MTNPQRLYPPTFHDCTDEALIPMNNYTTQREAIKAEQETLQKALDEAQRVAAQAQQQIQNIMQRGAQLDGKIQLLDELEKDETAAEPDATE